MLLITHQAINSVLALCQFQGFTQLTSRYSRITLEQDEKDIDCFPSYHLRCPTALNVRFHS